MGAVSNGYFYIAWMVASLLAVIGRSFGSSLFVESGRELNSIKSNTFRSLAISTIILLPERGGAGHYRAAHIKYLRKTVQPGRDITGEALVGLLHTVNILWHIGRSY